MTFTTLLPEDGIFKVNFPRSKPPNHLLTSFREDCFAAPSTISEILKELNSTQELLTFHYFYKVIYLKKAFESAF